MQPLLFCIPLKAGALNQYKAFVEETSKTKAQEWKEMLMRYDMSSVKIWHNTIEGKEYVFVYHDTGPTFAEKIQHWKSSTHPFDQWFDAQLNHLLDAGATDSSASLLLKMAV